VAANALSPGKRLRELWNAPGVTLMPGAYDALSAKIIVAQGFDAIVCGGYAATGAILGEPDTSQLTMLELADYYGRVAAAVGVPVYVDADTGFGGPSNVRRTVRAFERAGVAGMFFEDQVFPKRCGYMPGKDIIPVVDMIAKIKAAVDARTDPDFFITARTDVMLVSGIDAAIERAQLYVEAGADMGRVHGADNFDDLALVCREVPGLQNANMSQASGKKPMTLADIERAGACSVSFPSAALFAATAAVKRVAQILRRDGSPAAFLDDLMKLPEYYEIVGLKEQQAREDGYETAARALTTA
jgi:2-methylisocitrate lyase-like PEP mutase family enzyme